MRAHTTQSRFAQSILTGICLYADGEKITHFYQFLIPFNPFCIPQNAYLLYYCFHNTFLIKILKNFVLKHLNAINNNFNSLRGDKRVWGRRCVCNRFWIHVLFL